MHKQMTLWVSQVTDATAFLKRLYVALKDPGQRDRAEAAGVFAREWSRTGGRKPSFAPRPWIGLEPAQAERRAWVCAIQGLLGLRILVALAASDDGRTKPNSLDARLDSELSSAVRGFTTAFPREMVEADLGSICLQVVDEAATVAEGAWQEIRHADEADIDLREALRNDWLRTLRPALLKRLDQS